MIIDYFKRISTLTEHLKNLEIDLAVITDPTNIYYLTGFYADPHERYMSLFIDTGSEETYLFLPALDKEIAAGIAKVDFIIPISDEQDPFTIIESNIKEKAAKIGIEMNVATVAHHNGLKGTFPNAEFIDIQPVINHQRAFKSREEIQGL